MDKLLSVPDVAEWLGLTPGQIDGWIRHKGLYVRYRVGWKRFLTKSDVTKFVEINFSQQNNKGRGEK